MMDKAWVHLIRTSKEYKDGAKRFVKEEALRKQSDIITCPCGDCQNLFRHNTSVVYEHLVIKGMDKSYTTWILHGEEISLRENRSETSETYNLCRTLYEQDHHQVQDDCHLESSKDIEDEEFRDLLRDAECPLFPGCEEHTKLSATIILYKIKVQFGLSNKCFTTLLKAVKDLLPKENTLPNSKYSAEKLIKDFQLEVEEIHACVNDCCLFRKDLKDSVTCPTCFSSRWKIDERSNQIREGVPAKVLRYFPIIPRFKRMFGSIDMAKQLLWHSNNKSNDGNMRHPVDSKAWEEINEKWPSFGIEPRNLRLGLAADGINPYRQLSSRHSCWPVMLVIYNLPPWMCMKDKQIMLSLLIPGPKQPGNDICIYLQPLIDDLLLLWNDGVQVYDAVKNSFFTLRVILMWIVNDFPAYGNLAGCTTKGKTACPICGNKTMSQWLSDSRKTVYLGNRCFLELTHPFRMKKSWFDGSIEERERPIPLTGVEIYEEVKNINNEWGKVKNGSKRKRKGQVLQMWKKMSGFFQLPYWKDLVLRHNLDVMHIEKKVCENILNILLDVEGIYPSSAPYTLSKTDKKTFCKRLFNLKLPDSFSSNISRRVVVDDCKILGLKSHDCHVLMQQILPVMLRGLLPKGPRTAIYRLCAFFNALTQKVINKERMEDLEKEIAEILCIFERYFPNSFFDVMVHLLHHLPEEARLCGPVSDRWMYGFERYMKILKGYVKNPARPEGSIAKCYLADETLKFCSKYIRQAAEMDDTFGRNDDFENDLILEGRPISAASSITLSEEKMRIAHRYILFNTAEVAPYIEAHLRELKRTDKRLLTNERMLWQKHSSSFPTWFKEKLKLYPDTCLKFEQLKGQMSSVSKILKGLAFGPRRQAMSYKGYVINGQRYRTKDDVKSTQDSGVSIEATTMCRSSSKDTNQICDTVAYYGVIKDIILLDYRTFQIPLFDCDWVNITNGIKVDEGFTLVNLHQSNTQFERDSFILASQAKKVFYSRESEASSRYVVLKAPSRGFCDMEICDENTSISLPLDVSSLDDALEDDDEV